MIFKVCYVGKPAIAGYVLQTPSQKNIFQTPLFVNIHNALTKNILHPPQRPTKNYLQSPPTSNLL